jgi:hypothetical protein
LDMWNIVFPVRLGLKTEFCTTEMYIGVIKMFF